MAKIDELDSLKWNVPYNREKPIIYVKDCRLDIPDKEHYKDVYGLTTDLTELEKTSKYARYYYLGQAMPDAESLKAVEIGRSIDPAEAFLVEDYAGKMDVAGGAALKTGYCVMPGGIGFATTTVRGKGITAEVMSYFLDNFNPPKDLYYKTWCPGAHICHYDGAAIEDLGYGMCMLRFTEGLTAEKVGLPTPAKHDQYCIGLTGGEPRKDCVKENKRHPFSQEWEQKNNLIERMYYCGKDTRGGILCKLLCGIPVRCILLDASLYRCIALLGSLLYPICLDTFNEQIAHRVIIFYTGITVLAADQGVRRHIVRAIKHPVVPRQFTLSYTEFVCFLIALYGIYSTRSHCGCGTTVFTKETGNSKMKAKKKEMDKSCIRVTWRMRSGQKPRRKVSV